MAYFSYLPLELNAVSSEQVFRPIGVLKRSTHAVATFEGKIINTFLHGFVLSVAVVIAKLKA